MEEKIIKTAKATFIEKGFVETSMSEIAAKAGINRPVLHYYFRTKDKMFQAVFGDIVQSIVPKIFDIIIHKDTPIAERIRHIVDTYYAMFIDNPRFPMFIIREMNRDADLLINTAIQLKLPEMLMPAWKSLQEEMDEGKIRRVPLRFLFYNLYGLMAIPFLTKDLTTAVLLDDNETFQDILDEWKPYIISQFDNLLIIDK